MAASNTALLTCPVCGHQSVEEMPTDRCVFFHECAGCRTLLRPRSGDCCVFCSYGDRPCPPKRDDASCC
ncbi:MAG: GDCCVxC domain-containing (seleno)protein [Vicinamibacterales bacterium]